MELLKTINQKLSNRESQPSKDKEEKILLERMKIFVDKNNDTLKTCTKKRCISTH